MEVSPKKVAKDKKRKYINFSIESDETLHWGVCFSPEKHQLFSETVKDNVNFGIEIKPFCSSDKNNDIIVSGFKQ